MKLRNLLLPRWTLLGWFCAIGIGCLLIATWIAIKDARRAAARVKEVEFELFEFKHRHGYVQHELPATLQIKEVPMPHPCQWRYRLTLPPGRSYNAKAAFYSNVDANPQHSVLTLLVGGDRTQSREVILDGYIVHENNKAYFWFGLDDDYDDMERPPTLLPPGHFLHTRIPRISIEKWAAPQTWEGRRETGGQGRTVRGWKEIRAVPGQKTELLNLEAEGMWLWLEELPSAP